MSNLVIFNTVLEVLASTIRQEKEKKKKASKLERKKQNDLCLQIASYMSCLKTYTHIHTHTHARISTNKFSKIAGYKYQTKMSYNSIY